MKKNVRLLALGVMIGSLAFVTGCDSNNSNGKMDKKDQMQDMQKKHSDSMQDAQQGYSQHGNSSSSSDMHSGGCN